MKELRFEFGRNWTDFAEKVNDERVLLAMNSVCSLLKTQDLKGKTFLDIGCGSGLFSVAAAKLGADVRAFDFDRDSVSCTNQLASNLNTKVLVEQGSVLDDEFVGQLGLYDYVYSWGVLHHTGNMEKALENAAKCVAVGGYLAIAIYNDQGKITRIWRVIKQLYNWLPRVLKLPYLVVVGLPFELLKIIGNGGPFAYYRYVRDYAKINVRGMSNWNDLVDWIGGYPYEVAKPDQIFDFFTEKGFSLLKMKTCGGGLGCNEFLFKRVR